MSDFPLSPYMCLYVCVVIHAALLPRSLPGYAFVYMIGALQTVRKRIAVYEIPEHTTLHLARQCRRHHLDYKASIKQ